MSPLKKGQKLTDNPKGILVHFRADAETVRKLEYASKTFNISKSEVIRNGIEEQYQEAVKK